MYKLSINTDSQLRYSGTTITNLQFRAKIADYSHLFKRIGWCVSFPWCRVNRSKTEQGIILYFADLRRLIVWRTGVSGDSEISLKGANIEYECIKRGLSSYQTFIGEPYFSFVTLSFLTEVLAPLGCCLPLLHRIPCDIIQRMNRRLSHSDQTCNCKRVLGPPECPWAHHECLKKPVPGNYFLGELVLLEMHPRLCWKCPSSWLFEAQALLGCRFSSCGKGWWYPSSWSSGAVGAQVKSPG